MEPGGALSDTSEELLSRLVRTTVAYQTQRSQAEEAARMNVLLVDEMERLRLRWTASEREKDELAGYLERAEAEKRLLDSKCKTLKAELNDARTQVKSQLREIDGLKLDLDTVEKRFSEIRGVMKPLYDQLSSDEAKRLEFLRNPGLVRIHSRRIARERGEVASADEDDTTSDNINYDDQTADSLDMEEHVSLRNGRSYRRSEVARRRSQSLQPRPTQKVHASKRNRSRIQTDAIPEDNDDIRPPKRSREITTTTTVTVDPQGVMPPRARVMIKQHRPSMNRSLSESNLLQEEKDALLRKNCLMSNGKTLSTLDMRDTRTPQPKSWLGNYRLADRPHNFERLSTTFKITSCDVCHQGIHFAGKPAYKCLDCQQQVHIVCSKRLPVPCVLRKMTPGRVQKTPKGTQLLAYKLQDFCPPCSPMIPYPLIYLIEELQRRELTHEGLYRVPGKKVVVQTTLNELRTSRGVPKLNLVDIEVLADCVKQFLRDLRDPLIPKSSREEFISAAKVHDVQKLNNAINELPQPNRETLAYLVLHWLKIIELAPYNKMSMENVARCLALAVMGQPSRGELGSISRETSEREAVMQDLLTMTPEYWKSFLCWLGKNGSDAGQNANADISMLGPLTAVAGTPTAPRQRPQRFFGDLH